MKPILLISLTIYTFQLNAQSSVLSELKEVKIGNKIPEDVAIKYFEAKPDKYGTLQPIELKYLTSCGDTVITILTRHTGFGSYSRLTSFSNETRKEYFKERVDTSSDHDGAKALYERTDYNFFYSNIIEVIEYAEIVKDTTKFDLNTKLMTSGYSFWDEETETHETYSYIRISNNCSIEKLQPKKDIGDGRRYGQASSSLLSPEDLEKITTKELRLMRNEIFADYGHVFKSSDLKSYFESTTWYSPSPDDSTNKLTEVEKLNVDLILSEEKRRKSN